MGLERKLAPPLDPEVGREMWGQEASIAEQECRSAGDLASCGGLAGCVHAGAWLRFGRSWEDIMEDKALCGERLAALPWWAWRARRRVRRQLRCIDAMVTQLHGMEWVYA